MVKSMGSIENAIRRISNLASGLGAAVLVAIMALVVANIGFRFFGRVIPGTYELVQLLIVVTAAFALAQTAHDKGHIVVSVLLSRLPVRGQMVTLCITSFIGFAIWGLLAWGTVAAMGEGWLEETTELLEVPFWPVKLCWVLGLILLSLLLLMEFINGLRRLRR